MGAHLNTEANPLKLTLDQEQALWNFNESKQNLFLTGGAGTGKSFVLKYFLAHHKYEVPILASTGAAAILIGGRTFHSFFGLGVMQGGADAIFAKAMENKRLKKRMVCASQIIIDEISMLSAETIDCAERIARALRASDKPWGGLRVIAVGDFAQLPPVSRGGPKPWAFLGEAWAISQFKMIELKEVMRAEDRDFVAILEDLRFGQFSKRLETFLDSRTVEYVDPEITHLFPRRDQAEKFNLHRLAEIETDSRKFETVYLGDPKYHDQLKRDAPIPEVLELKKGALVMMRTNDPRGKYVNGSLGRVAKIADDAITVQLANRTVDIEPFAFGVQDADGNEVASAKNFPMNLAYGSTIHKVQGATLDRVHLDIAHLWEPGQAYVAVSRARRPDQLTIARWSRSSIKADPMVAAFYGRKPQFIPPKKADDELLTEAW